MYIFRNTLNFIEYINFRKFNINVAIFISNFLINIIIKLSFIKIIEIFIIENINTYFDYNYWFFKDLA